ncbi:unnamed protein product [Lupinus luteus]|uniref:Putative plant transposon protein domain-containing protein n=1 Tax=Lupinus luteus TaxID=3873 RepID=A0AAV1VYA2_LUPLU
MSTRESRTKSISQEINMAETISQKRSRMTWQDFLNIPSSRRAVKGKVLGGTSCKKGRIISPPFPNYAFKLGHSEDEEVNEFTDSSVEVIDLVSDSETEEDPSEGSSLHVNVYNNSGSDTEEDPSEGSSSYGSVCDSSLAWSSLTRPGTAQRTDCCAERTVCQARNPSRKGKEMAKGTKTSKYASKEAHDKFKELTLKNTITLERIVNFHEDDSFGFLCVVDQYGWQKIAQPQKMFSLDVVKQFFANSIATQEAIGERYTWVNGAPVSYNKYTINMYLGNPWTPTHVHGLCEYQMKINASLHGDEGHNEDYVRRSLCVDGLEPNQIGPIYKFCMHQHAQIWTTFILSNIWPSLHVSDLPLNKAKLVSSIFDEDTIDIGAILSDAIWECVNKGIPSLILPSLITDLCRFQNVPGPFKEMMALKSEINDTYVHTFCKEKSISQAQTELRKKHGELFRSQSLNPKKTLSSRIDALAFEHKMQNKQQKAIYRGIKGIYKSLHSLFGKDKKFKGGSYEEFCAKNKWPKGRAQDSSEEEGNQ